MKIRVLLLVVGLAVCWPAGMLRADTLILADGTRVSGTTVGVTREAITFKDARGVTRRYRPEEVTAIEFSSPELRRASAGILTLASETALPVRLLEVIDSSVAAVAQLYHGVFDEDIVAAGTVVVPKGSGTHIAIREAGVKDDSGRAQLRLEIVSIAVQGRLYRLADVSDDGSPNGEGTTVKPRVFSADFSNAAPAPSVIRLVGGPGMGAILSAGSTPEIESLPNSHLRVQAGAHVTFITDGLVTLQGAR